MLGRLKTKRRATLLMMVVGLLATLFLIVSAYIALARFDSLTLQSMHQAQAVDQVVQSLSSVVLSAIRQAWADGDGNLLAGGREDPNGSVVRKGYLDVDVPGYAGSRWLAGPAPVRDATSQLPLDGFSQLQHYRQTVSSFDDRNAPRHVALSGGLLLEDGADTDNTFELNDVKRNARRPFMDADGDGIPDSFFVGTGSLTDIANAIVGVGARAPDGDFNPSAIGDPGDPNEPPTDPSTILARMWQRFDELARYEVAVKVVSHGGMVALASPGNALANHVWNRQFVTGMFNWMRHRRDVDEGKWLGDNAWANARFQELAAEATSVEPFLRHRGGVLATYAEYDNWRGVPAVLRLLQDPRDGFFNTLRPVNNWLANRPTLYERFNLATLDKAGGANEWNLWRLGTSLDPDYFNSYFSGQVEPDPRKYYFPRQHITTISYSDELARVTDPHAPAQPNDPDSLGIYPGQPKFYLGDIAAAFDPQTGYFVEGDDNNPRGHAIIRRLANYYYEMLSGYDGWADPNQNEVDVSEGPTSKPLSTIVTRRQQAMMLAVNTVAFAAPRSPTRPGFIDAVWYTDAASGRTYVGYSPQLFITQAIAYCEGGDPAHIALAVELFNPNEPDADADPSVRFNNVNDDFALDLTQFALSVDGPDVPPENRVWRRLDVALQNLGAQRMTGRNFVTIAIHGGGNPAWDNHVDGVVDDVSVNTYYSGTRRQIDVSLGRIDRDGQRIWVIDRLTLGDLATALIPVPQGPSENPWVVDYYRDLGPDRGEAHFGGDWNGDGFVDQDHPARWRMVMDLHSGRAEEEDDPNNPITLGQYVETLNKPTPQPLSRRAPSVPLYTMNAGAGLVGPIHGDYRPASFPTVGFLLFVPRFSGVTNATDGRMMPMGDILRKQWQRTKEKENYDAETGKYPADFGHMPIFDNHQEARPGNSYFSNQRAGRIPWGLQVFDYFTTLNPYADYDGDGKPDIDLWRVPGRINVNTAPWYVLAGLPVLNPAMHIDRQAASPAFWSEKSGVFVGSVYDPLNFPYLPNNTLHRFDDSRLHFDQQSGWYRLGPYLAQAIVSYRDRLQYSSAAYNPLWAAYERNAGSYYRKEITGEGVLDGYAYDAIRRSGGKYGLLSLGELVNVYGFESPVLGAGGDPNNTLYNPLGRAAWQTTVTPDFFKAVSLMALLDTHFLTTRSNTFTVYMSLMDRDEDRQQASLRVQMTVDRSNLLPKLLTDENGEPILQQTGTNPPTYAPIIIQNSGLPEVLTRRQAGYFNTQLD